ncbi:MAG: MBL fold metallo-hydrolase [Bdellovibrionaceae bacterium]|nr:MBL fold metallo-hydrolase [Pseudobdellovibrionaceae bacterium]
MSVLISRILHAGYIFEHDNVKIVFDPIFENPFSVNNYAFPDVQFDLLQIQQQKWDAVFISHYHDDHCSLTSLNHIDRRVPIYMYCVHDEFFALVTALGFRSVRALRLNEAICVGGFEVIPRPALDRDIDSVLHIKVDGHNILNVVDSWIDPETMSLLKNERSWDVVLWPFQTMRELEVLSPRRATAATGLIPHEWVAQLQALNPRIVVPSSCQFIQETWSWYRQAFFPISYRSFARQVHAFLPSTQIVRLNPSRSIRLSENHFALGPSLDWLRIVGAENGDYEYQANVIVPSTSEIAKKFAALSEDHEDYVYHYCQCLLAGRINEIDPFEDPYFQSSRFWCLRVYDHNGHARSFYYHIHKGQVVSVDSVAGPLGWLTEIPLARLYGALVNGESLTSLYVRINDMVFAAEIEKDIQSVDILQDPLLCGLFNRTVSSYQQAQLRHLK